MTRSSTEKTWLGRIPKMILELINEFNKIAVYKVNIQTSILLLYTINKKLEIKILKIPFIIYFKDMKYLGINLTKDVKDLYFEICKTLLEKLKT